MRQVAATSSCGLPWTVLAAIQHRERLRHDHGHLVGRRDRLRPVPARNLGRQMAGGNPYDYHDALPAVAGYLCASGAGQDLRGALWAYNHAWYENESCKRPTATADWAPQAAGWWPAGRTRRRSTSTTRAITRAPPCGSSGRQPPARPRRWTGCSGPMARGWAASTGRSRSFGPSTGISPTHGLLDAASRPLANRSPPAG
jgi:hypothetical protein